MTDKEPQEGSGENNSQSISTEEHNKVLERARRFEGKVTDLEKRLEAFDGIDLDRLKAIEEDYNNIRKEKAQGNKEDIDALLEEREQNVRKEFGTKLEASDTEISSLRKRVKELEVVDVVMNSAASLFNDDCHEDVKGRISRYLDMKDGEIVVTDGEGNVRYSKANPSKLMTAQEFVEELAQSKPSWAKPQVKDGTKEPGARNGKPSNEKIYSNSEIAGNPALLKNATQEQRIHYLNNLKSLK